MLARAALAALWLAISFAGNNQIFSRQSPPIIVSYPTRLIIMQFIGIQKHAKRGQELVSKDIRISNLNSNPGSVGGDAVFRTNLANSTPSPVGWDNFTLKQITLWRREGGRLGTCGTSTVSLIHLKNCGGRPSIVPYGIVSGDIRIGTRQSYFAIHNLLTAKRLCSDYQVRSFCTLQGSFGYLSCAQCCLSRFLGGFERLSEIYPLIAHAGTRGEPQADSGDSQSAGEQHQPKGIDRKRFIRAFFGGLFFLTGAVIGLICVFVNYIKIYKCREKKNRD